MAGQEDRDPQKPEGTSDPAQPEQSAADPGRTRKPLPSSAPPSALNLRKPLPARPHKPSTSRIADIPGMMPPRSEMRHYGVEGKTLVVGREISLAGQITACDKLVVEGQVEADLDSCRQLDIAPSGTFRGSAEIEEAEISGTFEGKLVVTKRLRVRTSARITGEIAYGQIEVEAGGEISGDVRVLEAEARLGRTGGAS